MKTFLLLFVAALFSSAPQAERLPTLKPLATPSMIAETILDAPNQNPTKRFVKEEAPQPVRQITRQATSAPAAPIATAPAPRNAPPAVAATPTAVTPTKVTTIAPLPAAKESTPFKLTLGSTAQLQQMHFFAAAGLPAASNLLAQQFSASFPDHPRLDEALYYIATHGEDETKGRALQQLKIQFEGSAWAREAAYQTIWDFAQTNTLTSIFRDERAKKMQQRQAQLPSIENQQRTATLLSLIPGLGHAYLGEYLTAVALLVTAGLVTWALLFAIFWGQLPYAALCLAGLVGLYAHSITSARSLAFTQTVTLKTEAFNSWEDLRPLTPQQLLNRAN